MIVAGSIVAIGLAIGLGFVLMIAWSKPNTFRVQRAILIDAPPEKIFPLVNSPREMNAWNPFVKADPDLVLTYSGADSGDGAAHDWKGNSQVGRGRLEIMQSSAPARVVMKLDMFEPVEAHNTVEFTLTPESRGTAVTWAMYGPTMCLGKIMSVFVSMDKMVGSKFEAGLADLKRLAEK